jgi:hypothetical protein
MEHADKAVARSTRRRDFEIVPIGEDTYGFTASLVDRSFGGEYEPGVESVLMHHFTATGRLGGPDLELLELDIDADRHPFPMCPLVLPAAQQLVGLPIANGWRRQVLDRFGGERGCTHVTTLLLTLSELTTLVYFQRMNARSTYGPKGLAGGEWMATGLAVVPGLVNACHALVADGPVVRRALRTPTDRGAD